jgi:hypothetical protein
MFWNGVSITVLGELKKTRPIIAAGFSSRKKSMTWNSLRPDEGGSSASMEVWNPSEWGVVQQSTCSLARTLGLMRGWYDVGIFACVWNTNPAIRQ